MALEIRMIFKIGLRETKPYVYTETCQFSSVAQVCPTLCNPMNCSTSGFPVHHQLPEFTQPHVHPVIHAIQPTHCHSLLFPPSIFPSIRVFSNKSALCLKWPAYLSISISPSIECSGLIFFRIDWFDILLSGAS